MVIFNLLYVKICEVKQHQLGHPQDILADVPSDSDLRNQNKYKKLKYT